MKKILLSIAIVSLLPLTTMASDHKNEGVSELKTTEQVNKTHSEKKTRKSMHSMTDAEKKVFFDKRISEMKKHHEKMSQKIIEIEKMTLKEKEVFFKSKKHKMKNKKHKMKKICSKIDINKKYSNETAMTYLLSSERYKQASAEKQEKLKAKLVKFNSLPEEEKNEKINKRKDKLRSICDNNKL